MLSLAHRFQIQNILDRAVKELYEYPRPDDCIDLLSLAERCEVEKKHWVPCLRILVNRRKPLAEQELSQLSPGMVIRISAARDRNHHERSQVSVRILPVGPLYEATFDHSEKIVREIWGISAI